MIDSGKEAYPGETEGEGRRPVKKYGCRKTGQPRARVKGDQKGSGPESVAQEAPWQGGNTKQQIHPEGEGHHVRQVRLKSFHERQDEGWKHQHIEMADKMPETGDGEDISLVGIH